IRNRTTATTESFAQIECETLNSDGTLIESPHVLLSRFYENFALAIAGQPPLAITPTEAAHSVELASAIQFSSATKSVVTFPLDRMAYDNVLASRLNAPST